MGKIQCRIRWGKNMLYEWGENTVQFKGGGIKCSKSGEKRCCRGWGNYSVGYGWGKYNEVRVGKYDVVRGGGNTM